ncbi:hypothetical protein RBSWK_01572 [Rhodopirellula baltica SWK14]|uniref:Uncharacterized protein n=1 Tax=Rhodopirellula baltica SWK14 TaxID=993516 RepID=L7CN82_RHOBT|nr:hypothetical protein RBSWK_01572 [Rhodopirellula baltica SWK14]
MTSTNQTMQPSGEVGRFEVENLPSPPADRQRYPTKILNEPQ